MKKTLILLVIGLMSCSSVLAQEIRTRQYTPIFKQADYTSGQSDTDLWIPVKSHAVVDAYTISSNSNQIVKLVASNTVVNVHVTASQPVVSPGGFLWKGIVDEVMRVTTEVGNVSVTLSGWEEN